MLEGGTLIRVELMMSQLVARHLTQGVDEVPMVQVGEPVLIWVVRVGPQEEVVSGGILHSFLIMGSLKEEG